jgi:hypothetical protein
VPQYNIYEKPDGDYEAIKIGFSWPAFFFTWIWAVVKEMWLPAILIFLLCSPVYLGDVLFERSNSPFWDLASAIYFLAMSLWLGFAGNGIRESVAKRQGSTLVAADVYGDNVSHAKSVTRGGQAESTS